MRRNVRSGLDGRLRNSDRSDPGLWAGRPRRPGLPRIHHQHFVYRPSERGRILGTALSNLTLAVAPARATKLSIHPDALRRRIKTSAECRDVMLLQFTGLRTSCANPPARNNKVNQNFFMTGSFTPSSPAGGQAVCLCIKARSGHTTFHGRQRMPPASPKDSGDAKSRGHVDEVCQRLGLQLRISRPRCALTVIWRCPVRPLNVQQARHHQCHDFPFPAAENGAA